MARIFFLENRTQVMEEDLWLTVVSDEKMLSYLMPLGRE
jgi:hypothetical protein